MKTLLIIPQMTIEVTLANSHLTHTQSNFMINHPYKAHKILKNLTTFPRMPNRISSGIHMKIILETVLIMFSPYTIDLIM
jgi:hypothetical protein